MHSSADHHGITFALGFGSLLGAIREHRLIDAETDLDIFIDASDFHKLEKLREMFADMYGFET